MSSWSLLKWLEYITSGHILLNVHGLEVPVHSLLLDQGHGIERDLLSSRIIIAPSTMSLTGKIAFQWILGEYFTQQVFDIGDSQQLWSKLSKGLNCK